MIRTRKNQKRIAALAAILMLVGMLAGCVARPKEQGIPVRVLILPKFEAWADRQPQVLRGTALTGDNFWKGKYDHLNALRITETYGCADPFAVTEMEDLAVGLAVRRLGLLDRLIILRVSVNMDMFPAGVTPEMLWDPATDDKLASEDSMESVDIFETAVHNCFAAGRVLIDAILEGRL